MLIFVIFLHNLKLAFLFYAMSIYTEAAFYALKRLQPKKRKIVDRRASKSRKIRYLNIATLLFSLFYTVSYFVLSSWIKLTFWIIGVVFPHWCWRYHVHEKVVNFMAPQPMDLPDMAPKLFDNLFGLKTNRPATAAS